MAFHSSPQGTTSKGAPLEEDDDIIPLYQVQDHRNITSSSSSMARGFEFAFQGKMSPEDLVRRIRKEFNIPVEENIVLVNGKTKKSFFDASYDGFPPPVIFVKGKTNTYANAAVTPIKFDPSSKIYTDSGKNEYYGSSGRIPLGMALSELIDNSITALGKMKDLSNKMIKIIWDPSHKRLVLWDNGCGMTVEGLNDWATFRKGTDDRRIKMTADEFTRAQSPHRFLNSYISYYGVGGKQASFFIGSSVTMYGRPQGDTKVHSLTLSKEEFDRKKNANESIFTGEVFSKPFDLRALPCSNVWGKEDCSHFTLAVIENITDEHLALLDHSGALHQAKRKEMLCELTDVYHYYIFGVDKAEDYSKPGHRSGMLSMEYYHNGVVPLNLHDISLDAEHYVLDLESKFISTCKEERVFYVESKTGTSDRSLEAVVRYHPYVARETHPSLSENGTSKYSSDKPLSDRLTPLFRVYWNGRLIPDSYVRSGFKFCQPWLPERTSAYDRKLMNTLFNRLSGSVFLGPGWDVTTGKMHTVASVEEQINSSKAGNVYFEGSRVSRDLEHTSDAAKKFTDWLRECHEKYDMELEFHAPQRVAKLKSLNEYTSLSARKKDKEKIDLKEFEDEMFTQFNEVTFRDTVAKVDQYVRVSRPKLSFGKIVSIVLLGEYHDKVKPNGDDRAAIFLSLRQQSSSMDFYESFDARQLFDDKHVLFITEAQYKKGLEDFEGKWPSRVQVTLDTTTKGKEQGVMVPKDGNVEFNTFLGPFYANLTDKNDEVCEKNLCSAYKMSIALFDTSSGSPKELHDYFHEASFHSDYYFWFGAFRPTKLGKYMLRFSASSMDKTLEPMEFNFNVVSGEPKTLEGSILMSQEDGERIKLGRTFGVSLQLKDEWGNVVDLPRKEWKVRFNLEPKTAKFEAGGKKKAQWNSSASSFDVNDCKISPASKSLVVPVEGMDVTLTAHQGDLPFSTTLRLYPGVPTKITRLEESGVIQVENKEIMPAPPLVIVDEWNNPASPSKSDIYFKFSFKSRENIRLPHDFVQQYGSDGRSKQKSRMAFPSLPKPVQCVLAIYPLLGQNAQNIDKSIEPLEIEMKILPSRLPHHIQILSPETNDFESELTLKGVAGQALEGLGFRILNEALEPLEITEELVRTLKCSWGSQKKNHIESLKGGILPPIQVPAKGDSLDCSVSLRTKINEEVEIRFTVRVLSGEPAAMELVQSKVQLHVPSNLVVCFKDKHGNACTTIPAQYLDLKKFSLSCDGLDASHVTLEPRPDGNKIAFQGLLFSGKSEGRHFNVDWKHEEATLHAESFLEVLPGPPVSLQFREQHIQERIKDDMMMFSCPLNTPFPFDFNFFLIDRDGNETGEKSPVSCKRNQQSSSAVIILNDKKSESLFSASRTVNSKSGLFVFGSPLIKKGSGNVEFNFVYQGDTAVDLKPTFVVTIAELDRPEKLVLMARKNAEEPWHEVNEVRGVAGSRLDLAVRIFDQHGNVYKDAPNTQLSLKLKNESSAYPCEYDSSVGALVALSFNLPKEAKSDLHLVAQCAAPQQKASPFNWKLFTEPGVPTKLGAASLPSISISNLPAANHYIIEKELKIFLMDEYDNIVSDSSHDSLLNLQVLSAEEGHPTPSLVPRSFHLKDGACSLSRIELAKGNLPAGNYHLYISCSAGISDLDVPFAILPSQEKADKAKELGSKRLTSENRLSEIKKLRFAADEKKMRLKSLGVDSAKHAKKTRDELIAFWKEKNLPGSAPISSEDINAAITKCRDDIQKPKENKRKTVPAFGEKDRGVIGFLGNLAFVEDEDASRWVSYIIQHKFHVLVTRDIPTADKYKSSYVVWPSAYISGKKPTNEAAKFNGKLLLSFLTFPNSPDKGKIEEAFSHLLGSTVLFDTFDEAKRYKSESKTNARLVCRDNQQIESSGMYGGNTAIHNFRPNAELDRPVGIEAELIGFLERCKDAIDVQAKEEEERREGLHSISQDKEAEKLKKEEEQLIAEIAAITKAQKQLGGVK